MDAASKREAVAGQRLEREARVERRKALREEAMARAASDRAKRRRSRSPPGAPSRPSSPVRDDGNHGAL
jgi:hypothetical protein